MDQIKIGKFIQQRRKEQNLTQRQIAEKLLISDKTVSKWETGNGLPEVSLMLPLCELLSISVNELLCGELLSDADYKQRAEETIMDLVTEKQRSKERILVGVIVTLLTLLAGITLILISGLLEMETYLRIVLIAIGLVVIFGGISVAAYLDSTAGTYECRHCHARFVPTAGAYLAGVHTLLTRRLKCPNCGKKSFCRRRLTH